MRHVAFHLLSLLAASATFGALAPAQGSFTNFETPQTHPVELATVNGTEYVLVCNTPDNSLEIWTATASPTKLARVGVGLGPGSVRWNAALQKAYVCNFDGDSVSIVALTPSGGSVTGQLERTTWVGDEPADLAFSPNLPYAMVTLSSQGKVALVDRATLLGVSYRLEVAFNQSNGMYGTGAGPTNLLAVKTPRAIAWMPNDRVFVLNLMGNEAVAGSTNGDSYDLDLYRTDTPYVAGSANYLGKLGTTNHAFAVQSNGSRMFVVGTKAQNLSLFGFKVALGVTGFVQSWMSVVDLPTSGNLSLRAEATGGGPPAQSFPSINLNRNYAVGGPLAEIPPSQGISQPTDIDLFESAGTVQLIALSGYHSDTLGLLTPNAAVPGGYTFQRVSFAPNPGYSVVGPRGLAFNALGTLLFVHGRLDNSLRVVNTATLAASSTAMQDPTPSEVRTGRQFLYSTRFSDVSTTTPAGRGFVSCASCHVDGRTDGLLWDLSHTNTISVPAYLNDTINAGVFGFPFSFFPNPKGPMITQTLQGLVNSPINESFQFLATNAPYHWRGDKPGFVNFNEAFVNLQRMPNQPLAGLGEKAKGLSDADMISYRRFIHTIRQPANPEEALDRRPSGSVPANPNQVPTLASGFSGGKMGRAIYHNFPMVGDGRGCVDCHSLPEGSSNTLVLVAPTPGVGANPIETPGVRNLRMRDGMDHLSPYLISNLVPNPSIPNFYTPNWDAPGTALVSNRGLTHFGDFHLSTNRFLGNLFFNAMPSAPFQPTGSGSLVEAQDQIKSVVQFVREFDSGLAPASGFAYTVDPTLGNTGLNLQTFNLLEGEVKQANIGLGARGRSPGIPGTLTGYWFDPLAGGYRDLASPLGSVIPRTTLLATYSAAGSLLVLQGTPLGSERRWASPSGIAGPILSSANPPSALTLERMAPNTFFEGTSDLNLNLANASSTTGGTTRWRLTRLGLALAGANLGVPATPRHEPPRRFRVSGQDLRPGARLFLQMTDGSAPTNFYPVLAEMSLYPTDRVASNGKPIWETETELDPLQTYAFLCGGPIVADVQAILLQGPTAPFTGVLPAALTWNQYKILVVNEDGSASSIVAQPSVLRVQDTR